MFANCSMIRNNSLTVLTCTEIMRISMLKAVGNIIDVKLFSYFVRLYDKNNV